MIHSPQGFHKTERGITSSIFCVSSFSAYFDILQLTCARAFAHSHNILLYYAEVPWLSHGRVLKRAVKFQGELLSSKKR